jgi:hypothetical protein
VTALVNEAASYDLADFVDPVGKLISAVLDSHLGSVARQITAIDVRDA